jgi:catalase (peroxidase I)
MSVPLLTAECDGPIIPYRGGRVDVYWPAPDTAPLPFDNLTVHLEKFRREGFNREEMIGLVACGHTVGGVRNPDFPTISPPGPEVDYVALFDPTTKFDNLV